MGQERLNGRSTKGWLTAGTDVSVSSGFTLLEVIVTLTILGFILLMVSGTFRLGLSSWEKGDAIITCDWGPNQIVSRPDTRPRIFGYVDKRAHAFIISGKCRT